MKNNKGFTLVELIVIIAIMSILTGALTPAFIQYIGTRRERACRQNREAILSVFEKCVYNTSLDLADDGPSGERREKYLSLDVTQSDLSLLLDSSDSTRVPNEFLNQVKEYLVCPSAKTSGHYSGYVVDDKAYIVCSEHSDDVCMVDFTGWTGSGNELLADRGYPEEKKGTKSGSGKTPSGTKTPRNDNTIEGVWPYKTTSSGEQDPRWANASYNSAVGVADDASLIVRLPKYAHFIAAQSGVEYVIVQGNRGSSDTFRIMYKYADSPETAAQGNNGDLTWLIPATGIKYVYKTDDKDPVNGAPVCESTTPPGGGSSSQIAMRKGDMITVKYKYYKDGQLVDGEDTFIAWQDTSSVNVTTLRSTAVQMANDGYTTKQKYSHEQYTGGLYYVPELAKEINAADFY